MIGLSAERRRVMLVMRCWIWAALLHESSSARTRSVRGRPYLVRVKGGVGVRVRVGVRLRVAVRARIRVRVRSPSGYPDPVRARAGPAG